MIFRICFSSCLLLLFAFSGCKSAVESDSGPLQVLVSIEPQRFFVQRIAGERAKIEVLVPAGKEPETFTPMPDQMKTISTSRLFFRIGFPAETSFLPKLETIAPQMKVVDTRKGIALRELEGHSSHEHAEHDHVHDEGADPHIWISPKLVKIQATTIRDALVEIDPEGKEIYEKNCAAFVKELDEFSEKIEAELRPFRGQTLYVFHPTYGYFCDEFGLKQKAIEIEGKSPTAKDLAKWIEEAKNDKVRVILIQPEFNPEPAKMIAQEIGAQVIVHSTLETNLFEGLNELVAHLRTASE